MNIPARSWSGSFLVTVAAIGLFVPARAFAQAEKSAPPPEKIVQTKDAPMAASERLVACARKYATAKTYRDEGNVALSFDLGGCFSRDSVSDNRPFRTAFERGGRFRWEFRSSVTPGATPDQKYVVRSRDQKSFEARWTLDQSKQVFDDFDMAMAGPTGISGGSATAILPLLRSDVESPFRTTDVRGAMEKGKEHIDGVECTMIEGTNILGQVTLWLDPAFAIRKVHQVQQVDPAKVSGGKGEKFTVWTTITLKPVFDEQIDDDRFEVAADAK